MFKITKYDRDFATRKIILSFNIKRNPLPLTMLQILSIPQKQIVDVSTISVSLSASQYFLFG
jgi:hypothetical protein